MLLPYLLLESWGRAISNIFSQIPLPNEFGNLFLQMKIIFCVVSVISVEFVVLILVPFLGVSFDFYRPLEEFFMFDLNQDLGNGGVEGWQY